MSLEWLDEIERRANAATPGPWGRNKYGGIGAGEFYIHVLINIEGWEECTDADLEFIAHARADVPKLCRAVREMAEALSALLDHVEVDEDGLNCAIDECCAGPAVLKAREILERWRRGGEA